MKSRFTLIVIGICLATNYYSTVFFAKEERTEKEVDEFGSTAERKKYARLHGSDHSRQTRRAKERNITQGRSAQGSLQANIEATRDVDHSANTAPLKKDAIYDDAAKKTSAQERVAPLAQDEAIVTDLAKKEAMFGNAAENSSRQEKNARSVQ